MANIKLGDLYLSKEESKDIIELLAKKRNIKNYKSKSSDRLYHIFKKQSKNKKRIDDIRKELINLKYNDCNWIQTHNHLVHKRTLNHLAKLAK